jgi:disulfide bond formation protein DsbB
MMGAMNRLTSDAKTWLLLGALASAVLLAGAHAFETFGRYEPCELCYFQRDVHWLALWFGAVGFGVSMWRPGLARIACFTLGLIFLASTTVAAYHAGVEWKWWPGPPSCTGAHFKAVSAADMARLLSGVQNHVVACDDAAWRMFGVSMAGYNAAISAALAALSFVFAFRSVPHG